MLKNYLFLIIAIMLFGCRMEKIEYKKLENGIAVEVIDGVAHFYSYFHISSFYTGVSYSFSKEEIDDTCNNYLSLSFTTIGTTPENIKKLDWGGFELVIPVDGEKNNVFWYSSNGKKKLIPKMTESEYRKSIGK